MASAPPHYFSPLQIKCKPQKGFSCSRKHLPLQTKSLGGPGEHNPPGSQKSSRRSANYHPSIWDHHLIESTRSPYMDKCFNLQLNELKSKIKLLFKTCKEPLDCLHLIDSIQRLGVAYHFEEEIKDALDCLDGNCCSSDLHEAALRFRLLRQHAYKISSDMFNRFIDDGGLKICFHHDVRGLLSLYEASYLSFHGETTLEKAMETTAIHLKSLAGSVDIKLAEQVRNSMEIPLYWRIPRLEAKHYMNLYASEEGSNSSLHELARLDFNVVQSIHQEELRELSRWWKDLGLGEKLKFSRDRLVENYFWAAGIAFEPQYSNCRKGLTQMICILTVIDDIYDVHGSPEELQLFTAAVESWNLELLESLPDYMKLCYLALYNSANEVAYGFLKDNRQYIIPLIKEEWKCLCKAYLTEAEWFNKGYTPSLKEYLEKAWISVGGPVAMAYAYFLGEFMSSNEVAYFSEQGLKLIYLSSLITRISNDLGTSKAEMQRGDTPKSIECYMFETGESEENSRTYIKGLVRNLWEELNEECIRTPLPRNFVNMVLNMARTAQSLFQHGDGIGTSTGITKDQITSLFFDHV